MPTPSTTSSWKQAWQWATSPALRAEQRAERAFLQFLEAATPGQQNDPAALATVLDGAAPDLVNRPLPIPFGPTGQPGLSPLMWALLTRRWALATHLLANGADPTGLMPAETVEKHVEHLPSSPSYHERLSHWPRALLSPLTVAVLLTDKAWEEEHKGEVYTAWVDNAWAHQHRDAQPTLDQHPTMGPLLTALLAHEDLPWTLPEASHEDPEVRADSAPVRLLVGQGSTLMAWPDVWLQRMNLDWSNRNGGLLCAATRGCFACRHMDLDHLPALQRLLDLGVDPQAHARDWRTNPVSGLVQAVTMGPLKPGALLHVAFDERFDWEARNHRGHTAWENLNAWTSIATLDPKQNDGIKALLDELHTRRVEREARELRRAVREVERDQRMASLRTTVEDGETEPAVTATRSRHRL